MKTFHGNPTPKSPTLRDRDASFSSYLRPDHKPTTCQPHHTIESDRCTRALDDSTSEISIFDAHKYFNEVTTNNDIQKVTISSNSRVSPLVNNMDTERNPEKGDIITETSRYSSASSSVDGYANIRNYRARSFHAATPTASSEASWNSQAGLLSHPPGAIPISMRNPSNNPTDDLNKKIRASLSKPLWLLRRKCPCSGKKSVEVREPPTTQTSAPSPLLSPNQIARDSLNLKRQELESNPKMPIDKFTINMEAVAKKPENPKIPITPNNWVDQIPQDPATFVRKSQRFQPAENQIPPTQRVMASVRPFTDGFSFPVLNPDSASASTNSPIKLQVHDDPPRDSLEVFLPPDVESTSVSTKFPIDRDRQNFPFPPSPKSRIIDDDAASDASSDLFEIESFSTQTTSTYPMIYRRRDSLDEDQAFNSNLDPKRSAAAITNNNSFLFGRRHSIDGSLTPTITECYEPSEASIDWSVTTAEGYYDRASVNNFSDNTSSMVHGGGENAAEKWKRKGSMLSCQCEKAVSVGPPAQPVKGVGVVEGQRGTTGLTSSRHVNVNGNVSTSGNSSSSGRAGMSVNNKAPLLLAKSHNTARVSLAFAT